MLDLEKLFAGKYAGAIEFFIEAHGSDGLVGRMPVKEGMLNPFGTIHAGALPLVCRCLGDIDGDRGHEAEG